MTSILPVRAGCFNRIFHLSCLRYRQTPILRRYTSTDAKKYSDTLNLPTTDFPIRVNPRVREPALRSKIIDEFYAWQVV